MPTDPPTNILVVDDLPEKLLVYQTILEELGQNVVTASSGEEALRAVLKSDFAVILLDVQMPGMSGLETAAFIRQRRRSAHTPIIFLTAFTDEVRIAEGYAQGAVDYITTPVVPAILRAKVRVFCDLYRMTQLVRRQAEERIALVEERTRREAAEEANRRLGFSAWTGAALGQSLDQDVTTREILRLPIPFLADSVVLFVSHPRGGPGRYFRARDGEGGPVVEEVAEAGELPPGIVAGIEAVQAGTAAPCAADVAAVTLPLRTHGQTFAAVVLSREFSGRKFGPPDLTLAEAYASRAAVALENARLYHEVQQADRQKNDFLSMLAHELRNPLAPIRNANNVLREVATDPDRVLWAHGVIDRQLSHLVRLVDDLLDVSRLTHGKIRLAIQPVELARVVEQAVESVRPLVDQLKHQLHVTLPRHPVAVSGDPARLTQVLTNLLNNAAKYCDPGGQIGLHVGWEPEAGGEPGDRASRPAAGTVRSGVVEIRVRDTGIGIPPDLLPSMFDLFTQASRSLDRSQGGLGVGLTLVRRLVEMHRGTVEARSEGPGRGSEFIVRLPATADEPAPELPQPAAPAEPASGGDSLRVVVVDDNVDGAESLAEILGMLGHQVRVAHDGPAGIAAVREFDPDLVLLDIGLPGMDGHEVARRLRSDPRGRAVLVALSGYGREEDRAMSRQAGFVEHFVKPMDLGVIRTLLGSLSSSHRAKKTANAM